MLMRIWRVLAPASKRTFPVMTRGRSVARSDAMANVYRGYKRLRIICLRLRQSSGCRGDIWRISHRRWKTRRICQRSLGTTRKVYRAPSRIPGMRGIRRLTNSFADSTASSLVIVARGTVTLTTAPIIGIFRAPLRSKVSC